MLPIPPGGRLEGLMQGTCVRLRGIFTPNQIFYVSWSLQAAAIVPYVCALAKTHFHELWKIYTAQKKKGGNDFFWNRVFLANSSVM